MGTYGIIDAYLKDERITEIMINGTGGVFVEKEGYVVPGELRFGSADELYLVIDAMLESTGKVVSAAHPCVDARLPDGSRVNVVIPPAAVSGPVVTIRKFRPGFSDPEVLARGGVMSEQMLTFMKLCIAARRNIVVSGPTASGKTTILNALSRLIPADERIVSIEDTAELQLCHENWVRLESIQGDGSAEGISIRQLLKNALRMRPDRILVGECRGGETLDMLQAMNTGHSGSMTTVHANSARDCLKRIEVMTLMGCCDLPLRAVREQVSAAVNIVIQTSRAPGGARRITSITEVTGMEGDVVTLAPLFEFTGGSGGYRATRVMPRFVEQMGEKGGTVFKELFA